MTHYHIHFDETGSETGTPTDTFNERYLSITGVILHSAYGIVFDESFRKLRERHFGGTREHPVILHRRKMVSYAGSFAGLKNIEKRLAWEEDFLSFLYRHYFHVITVVVDKLELKEKYPTWRVEPYHLAITNALERYTKFLESARATGEIIAEQRSPERDRLFQTHYKEILATGSYPGNRAKLQKHLFPSVMIVAKEKDIPGLQLADLVASPSLRFCVKSRTGEPIQSPLGNLLARMLVTFKYYRDENGTISGRGIKWIP